MLKRKTVPKKTFEKNVTKIATKAALKVVNKVEETKQVVTAIPNTSFFKNTIKSWNLMAAMARGTGANQFIGGRIALRGIKINLVFLPNIVTYPTENSYVDIAIITTDKYITSNLDNTDVQDSLKQDFPTMEIDSSRATVLWTKRVKLTRQFSGAYGTTRICEYVKLSRSLEFREFATDYSLKKENYYLVMRAYNLSGAVATSIPVYGEGGYAIYFKDP